METTEKNEVENNNNRKDLINNNNNNEFTDSDNNNMNKEAEERQARELKAGLHPLKVFFFCIDLVYVNKGFFFLCVDRSV